ncbi:MAG: response regulator transcription factor [Coriobacteriales bacterium]|jgi:DNA-binding response OmpR family regulator|nr:response regulator transcription factor [Coriobacteriales bacterium]
MRILLIEDEKYIARAVAEVLKKSHYAVDVVHDGNEGLAYGATGIYDLIVLDIMLPGLDGLSILKKLRADGLTTPVILLTARNATTDKVSGLDAGADDYLPKPFHTEELLARIRALARRNPGYVDEGALEFSDLCLAPWTLTLSCGGRQIQLSVKVAQLLELLMVNKGAIVAKETILRKLWGFDADAGSNHVEAHVSLLRKALAQAGSRAGVKAVRGLGYRLVEPQEPQELQADSLSPARPSAGQAPVSQCSV